MECYATPCSERGRYFFAAHCGAGYEFFLLACKPDEPWGFGTAWREKIGKALYFPYVVWYL